MASSKIEGLESTIQHYAKIAETVNRREMKRFIEEIRKRWNPEPEEEWDPRGEGYTDEGALAKCIYELAFTDCEPPRPQENLCEAEKRNEVLLVPVESLVDWVPKPTAEPRPQIERAEKFSQLKATLQQQLDKLAMGTISVVVELPKDFETLMAITDGLGGAGVPSETAHTCLVKPLQRQQAEIEEPSSAIWRMPHWEQIQLAAWEIGCCHQFRHIYYVLCQISGSAVWKVLDVNDVYWDYHDSLADFLRHEAQVVEKRPGGALQEHIIYLDSYPV